MTKQLLLLCALLSLCACATPEYVLHWRAPTGLCNFLKSPKEDAPIASQAGVALLYDRARWVISERRLEDGSAWVHYALNVKNTNPNPIQLGTQEIRLESSDGSKSPALFEKKDQGETFGKVDANSLYQVSVKFHLSKAQVENWGGSSDPIELVVPLKTGGDLKQKVWLWKE